jgi:HEAT repeat protein
MLLVLVALAIPMIVATGVGGRVHGAGEPSDDELGERSWGEAVALLRDPASDLEGRRRAAATLETLALDEGYGAEVRAPEQVRPLRDELAALAAIVGRKGDDLRVRMTLARVLAAEPLKPLTAGVVPALLGVVVDESDDPALRGSIIARLAPIGPIEPCLAAVLAAARSPAVAVRASALYTLERMKIDPDRCLAVAEAALDDPEESVRLAALDLAGDLAEKRQSRAVAALLRAFHHRDRALRMLALVRLRALGPDAAPALDDLNAALEDPDPRVRNQVATVLADLTGNAAAYVPYLIDGLRSKDVHVWRSSASALMFGWRPGTGNGPGTASDARIPALSSALGDPDPDVRGRAAIVLAHVTRRVEQPYAQWIRSALESSDPATRKWAALWGRTVLRGPMRVDDAPTPTPHAPRTSRRPSVLALGVGLLTVLGLGVLAWFDARARR